MYDHELDRFKSDIHLVHFAVDRYGYRRDRRESSRASHVLRHLITNDKIIVRRDADGHWTYFSVRDDRDNGTVIDFVKERGFHHSLRGIRRELRSWIGTATPEPEVWFSSRAPLRDLRSVADAFAAARASETYAYLTARGLRRETLCDPRFAGTWRQDRRGSALFVHRDDAGEITGFEIKCQRFTGFASGGTKSAWQSAARYDDKSLVITESAIDALSYHQLHAEQAPTCRYLSTAGAPSTRQFALLQRIFAALPASMTVIAAVDSDEAGDKLAKRIEELTTSEPHLIFRRDSPSADKDWNDVLRRAQRG
jgi:hypothetical protein